MTDNLSIWNALGKTDPAHTKGFKRGGGFSGTSVKPMWILRRLTEHFGPAGVGWGVNEPRFETVHGVEGEVLVYCTVSAWHGSRENVLWGVGGDKVVSRNKNGLFHDDEAFKKAFTDAVNNAFKSIGVAADIHMGMFDDDKYVAQVEQEFSEPPELVNRGHLEAMRETMRKVGLSEAQACKNLNIAKLEDATVQQYDDAIAKMNEVLEEQSKKQKEPA